MKPLLFSTRSLPLALLLNAGLVNAEQPFTSHELERRLQAPDCRIREFTCATCGHITDDEQWDEKNRLLSDIEACEKRRAEQSSPNKTQSSN